MTGEVLLFACVILVGLFALQHSGTHRVAFAFAPIVLIWLVSIFSIGLYNIIHWNPKIVSAISPHYIIKFFKETGTDGWISLGGVLLSITGTWTLLPMNLYLVFLLWFWRFVFFFLLSVGIFKLFSQKRPRSYSPVAMNRRKQISALEMCHTDFWAFWCRYWSHVCRSWPFHCLVNKGRSILDLYSSSGYFKY